METKPIVSLVTEVEVGNEVTIAIEVTAMAGETMEDTGLMDHR